MFKVITRFAPSPTGYMHLGNIRTALFCWLFARKYNGKFLLRIDDTDRHRYSKKYVNNIFDSLNWLGLNYDGDVIFQSRRYARYKFFLDFLLHTGKAYKCYCTKERLDKLKEYQLSNKLKLMYDGFCKDKTIFSDRSDFVIRFVSNIVGYTEFDDIIRGKIRISNEELDDFIIAKDSYNPTYNFASCIDDIDYSITYIIRGEDHISNTQKQIALFQAFDKIIPKFAHLPMILDQDKKKLSKRDNSLYIDFYKKNGFLPMAVLNYIVRLGWGYKNLEIFSLLDMIKYFDVNDVSSSSSCINMDKLMWLNKHYIQNSTLKQLYFFSLPILKSFKFDYFFSPSITKLLEFNKGKFFTLYDIFDKNSYLYTTDIIDNLSKLSYDYYNLIINFFYDLKKSFYIWTSLNIKIHIDYFIKENLIIFSDFSFILRTVLVGVNVSTPLYELIFLSGKILILKKIINTLRKVGL